MGTGRTVPGLLEVTAAKPCRGLLDCLGWWIGPGNSPSMQTVPETDTGGPVEHTEALEGTMPKELGKLLA